MKDQLLKLSSLALLGVLMTACGGSSNNNDDDGSEIVDGGGDTGGGDGGTDDDSALYTVQFTNLTFNQPLSPAAIILHTPGFNAFVDGEAASLGIEELAEAGSPDELLVEAQDSIYHLDSLPTTGATPPKTISEVTTLTVSSSDVENLRLSFATMLVNTNDAFTALNAVDVSGMTVDQSITFTAPSWDSGTEANTETADSMPGPAAVAAGGGGEAAGFDAARDDLFDRVHFHRGALTNANAEDASLEGLSTSVLNESHRWDNPTARVTITRTR